jgi:hypothetical protein
MRGKIIKENVVFFIKSPLIPLFQRGKRLVPLFGKEGLGEIFHP